MNSLESLPLGTICAGAGAVATPCSSCTMRAALLPLDHPHPELGRFARQFLAGFIANDRPLGAALGAVAILRATGDDLFAAFQVFGQRSRPGWLGRGCLARGSGWLLCSCGRSASWSTSPAVTLTSSSSRTAWSAGELLALGAEEPEVEQADLLVLELDDALQPRDFRPANRPALGRRSGVGGNCII